MASHEFQPSPVNQAVATTMHEKRASKNLNMDPSLDFTGGFGNPTKNSSQSMMTPQSMQQTHFPFGSTSTNHTVGRFTDFQPPRPSGAAPSSIPLFTTEKLDPNKLLSQLNPSETGQADSFSFSSQPSGDSFSTAPNTGFRFPKAAADSEKPTSSNGAPFGAFSSSSAPVTNQHLQFPKVAESAFPPFSNPTPHISGAQEKSSQSAITSLPAHLAFGASSTTTKSEMPTTFGLSTNPFSSAGSSASTSQSTSQSTIPPSSNPVPNIFGAPEKSSQLLAAPASSQFVFGASTATMKSDIPSIFSSSAKPADTTNHQISSLPSFGPTKTDISSSTAPLTNLSGSVSQPTSNMSSLTAAAKADTPNTFSSSNKTAESRFFSNSSAPQMRLGTMDSLPAPTMSTEPKTQGYHFPGIKEQPASSQPVKTASSAHGSLHSFGAQGAVSDPRSQRPEGSLSMQSTAPKVEPNPLGTYLSQGSNASYFPALSNGGRPDGNAGNVLSGRNIGQLPKPGADIDPRNETKPPNPLAETVAHRNSDGLLPGESSDRVYARQPQSSSTRESGSRDGASQGFGMSSYLGFGHPSSANGGNGSSRREPNSHDNISHSANEPRIQPRNEAAAPSDPPRNPNPGQGGGSYNGSSAQRDSGSNSPPPGPSHGFIFSETQRIQLEEVLMLIDELIRDSYQDEEGRSNDRFPSEHAQLFSQDQLTQAISSLQELKCMVDKETEFTAGLLQENMKRKKRGYPDPFEPTESHGKEDNCVYYLMKKKMR